MTSFALNSLYLILLLSFFKFYTCTKAQDVSFCNTAINYTSGSAFQQNLNLTLTFLAANTSSTNGFSNVTVGQGQDVVYGRLRCTGDVSNQDCEACAKNASTQVRSLCPNQKEASLFELNCLLQYSFQPLSLVEDSSQALCAWNLQNASDSALFSTQLGNLMTNLSSEAASSSSKLATGFTDYTNVEKIYAMTQCTTDLQESSCSTCLQGIISQIPSCCGGKVGGRIISTYCNLRFETYSFSLSPPASPSPEPASPSPEPASPSPEPASSPSPQSPGLSTTGTGTTNTTNSSGKRSTSKKIAVVVAPVAAASVMFFVAAGFLLWRNSKKKRFDNVHIEDDGEVDSLLIPLKSLKLATKNFSDANKLGQGGFGSVYKGKLPDGRKVAVKRLSRNSGQGLAELRTEVMLVAKLLHRNLVRLLGFCLEDEEKLLVYEFLPNGSLDQILFDQRKKSQLNWERRYKIITGISRGLLYLHEDSQLRVIHRDLKASNILLDEHMNPKISDFGLARLFPGSQTQANTNRIAGTYGYMAPEYVKNGNFSVKSDVYSFGMLVLELLTGRKNSNFRNSINLQSYAWNHWSNGTAMEVLDPSIDNQWPRHEVLTCIHIGLLCVQEAAANRPTMSDIVMMLNSYSVISPAPTRPAFFVAGEGSPELTKENTVASQCDQSTSEVPQQSMNEITITDLDGR